MTECPLVLKNFFFIGFVSSILHIIKAGNKLGH